MADGIDTEGGGETVVTAKLAKLGEVGTTGLVRYGTSVDDEFHRALKGNKGIRALREMRDNDSTVGASVFVMDSLVRQVPWTVTPADHPRGEDAAMFFEECLGDMSHTFQDFLSEALSMVWFGWSWFEVCWKYRRGPTGDAKSRYSDGKLGLRKLAIRAQETLDGWEFDEDGGIMGMWQRAAPTFKRVLIPIEKSVLFRPQLSKNNPEGRSLLRSAYRSWFFLKRLQELEAIGIERDLVGIGKMELPTSYFDTSASADKKNAIVEYQKMLSQLRRNEHEGIVVPAETLPDGKPSGFKFSLVTTGGTRALDIDKAITRYAQAIAQTIATQFIFLGMQKVGTQALGSELTEVFAMALATILDTIEETWDRFVTAELIVLNGYPIEAKPRLKHGDVKKADLRPLAEMLLKLTDGGLLTADATLEDYLRSEARLPEREGKDDDPDDPNNPIPNSNGGVGGGGGAAEGAATLLDLSIAIQRLARIGDVELVNASRNAYAALLGLPAPKPLTAEELKAFVSTNDPNGDGGGDPNGGGAPAPA